MVIVETSKGENYAVDQGDWTFCSRSTQEDRTKCYSNADCKKNNRLVENRIAGVTKKLKKELNCDNPSFDSYAVYSTKTCNRAPTVF